MNPKIFAKAFQDIRKQSEKQKQKKKDLSQKLEKQQAAKLIKANEQQQAIQNDSEDEGKGKKPLIKRISKQVKNANEKQMKKWRNDLYQKIESGNNEQNKKKLSRTLFIQNYTYEQVMKVLDKYKIYIEQIQSYKLVLSDEQKTSQCFQLLKNAGLIVRKANQSSNQIPQTSTQSKKEEKIFERIK